ncbi:hypothetical protein CRYUN_Cryun05aG0042500 [Craigia yunnanensis]
MKHLQKQAKPKGVELTDNEFILHVELTASTQRIVRHIGGICWPGRLILTNYALYFETSGVITYEDALKIDLSKDIDHCVKPAATGSEDDNKTSLETAINQTRKEEREVVYAKAEIEGLKEEGISENALILMRGASYHDVEFHSWLCAD